MLINFNSTFGGIDNRNNPHAIQPPKEKSDFNSTFGNKGQDISRHAIPPAGRIGQDLSNQVPSKDINQGAVATFQTGTPNLSGGGTSKYPFTCTVSGTNMTVSYGTVNSFVPSNISSTFVIPSTGTRYVNLNVSTTNCQVTGVTVSVDSATPTAIAVALGQPPPTFSINIAVVVNAIAYRTIGGGSLTVTSYEVYRLAKAMTSPDSIPYDSYYSWRLGLA